MHPPPLIVIVGPTASGKTTLAAGLAAALGAEVVNADALQLYSEVVLGVAKPDAGCRSLAPHHLFDVASVREKLSVGAYVRRASRVLEDLRLRGIRAVVVGGTGLYVTALLEGIDEIPEIDPSVQHRVRGLVARHGAPRLHRLLARVDPPLAARLPPADAQRIGRGLEVAFGTGRRLSSFQRGGPASQGGGAARAVTIGIRRTREDLRDRITHRVALMWSEGLLEEARRLQEMGLRGDVEHQKPIGYREAFSVLDGLLDPDEAMRRTVQQTVALAKRQMTWWRKREVTWLDVEPGEEPSVAQAAELVASWDGAAAREAGW